MFEIFSMSSFQANFDPFWPKKMLIFKNWKKKVGHVSTLFVILVGFVGFHTTIYPCTSSLL